MDREEARRIYEDIVGENVDTQMYTDGERLYAKAPGGLTPRQVELLKGKRDLLIWLLRTPPAAGGTCVRGHEIEWTNVNGRWLCSCYLAPPATVRQAGTQLPAASIHPLRNYWVKN